MRFYLDSLSWGLGWGASAAAAAGLAWQARVDRRRALLLALFPVLLFAYLCTAERSFARWLMPAYPVLALLAGLALARAAAAVTRRPALRAGVLAALLAAVLAQPVAADLRTARVLGREDTRTQARAWVLGRLPAGTKAVVEPAFPLGFFGTAPRARASRRRRTRPGTTAGPRRASSARSARRAWTATARPGSARS